MTIVARLLVTLSLAIVLSFPCAVRAQGEAVTLNLKDADIREVIDLVSQVTGRNFIIDPRVRANVSVVSSRPLSPDGLYETFLSILQVHQFAAIPSGDAIKIVPEATARHSGAAELPEPFTRPGDDVITQVIQVENVQASQLVPILRPLVPQYGHLAAFSASNMLIISDRAGNVDRMISIVRRIDQASDEEIEVIRLEHASATETVRLLQALVQGQQRGDGAPQTSMIADERTNSVLVGGDRAMRLRLRALIAHLDTPLEAEGHTQVIYLRYGDADNIADILRGYADGRMQSRAGGEQQRGGVRSEQITILPDQTTNALVITAPPDAMRSLRGIIEQLDIRRAQVLVEAIIVEMTADRTADFGIQWAVDASDRNRGAGVVNFTRGGTGIVELGTGGLATLPEGMTFGIGRIRDRGTSFAALVHALAADARSNILSTPHLMAMDNEEAEFSVGQQVPFLTGQFSQVGQQQQPGVVNPFQTINREDVGLMLRITPKINEGDAVQLTIEQEVSSLAPAPAGAVDLVTNRREIRTRVIVEDGDIIVLGGLIDDSVEENEERVPLLGSIPILGHAFRYQRSTQVKRNLMVFLRPQILRDGLESNYHTNQRYTRMREMQEALREEEVPLLPGAERPLLPELEERSEPPEN